MGYVGSHGYHELIGVDANAPAPVVCPRRRHARHTLSEPSRPGAHWPDSRCPREHFIAAAARPNRIRHIANTWTWFSEGTSSYNALQVDVNHRFSSGLALRGVYTWSKTLDDGDSLNATAAANAPGLLSNPYDPNADWGLATYDVRNIGVVTVEL